MEYSKLVEIYEKIEGTTKRLEKTHYISELLKKAPLEDIDMLILLLQGRVFPVWDETKIGVSSNIILKVINKATGADQSKIENEWKRTGDLGDVAKSLTGKKSQATLFSSTLTVKKVFENIKKVATLTGFGAIDKKVSLIAELLTSAKPNEAKYIVRTVLEELRVGIGEGSIRDAIVWAFFGDELGVIYSKQENDITLDFEKRKKYMEVQDIVQHAYNLTNDFSSVAHTAKKGGVKALLEIKLSVGVPIKVMLSQKVSGIEEGFERLGSPVQIEYKYDGFRMQIHKTGQKITLYTRRLENVTSQFPEVVAAVKEHVSGNEFIIDGEAVGFDPKSGKYMPFQNVSQRIKRKYDIEEVAKSYPVELNLFDIIYYNGKSYVKTPLDKRRKLLEKIVSQKKKSIVIANADITSDRKEAEKFYEESLKSGNEGIIMKKHDSLYVPGSRVGGWVKVKPVMESLDVVIIGAEWGEGKRSGWLTSFTIAVVDQESGEFLGIGKVGTGIKELEQEGVTFDELTKLLKPLVMSEKGKEVAVKPKIVIEVNYEEIQKSPTYSSGFALRFPRFVRLRDDRSPDEASTLDMAKEFYAAQRGR